MKSFLKKIKVVKIDVFIYSMKTYEVFETSVQFPVESISVSKNKKKYFIKINNEIAHESHLFKKVYLLRSIKKRGPVIGDCLTKEKHRGKSLYPYTINKIAKEVLATKQNEIFIIVNKNNTKSIKGIEKAHFKKIASVKGKRWLWFYLKLKKNVSINEIQYYNKI